MKVNVKYLLLLLVTLSIYSCRTSKFFYSEHDEIKNISDSRLLKSVESNYLVYNNIYVKKFNADVTLNGSRKSFSGSLFFQRDSHMVMTVAPLLGIELFRAKLQKDSVFLIDRTKRSVYAGSYDLIEKTTHIDVNFSILQAIFTNEMFIVNENINEQAALKRFKHYITDSGYLFNSVKLNRINRLGRSSNIIQSFEILPGIFKINQSSILDLDNHSEVIIKYSELIKVGDVWFPSKIEIKGSRGGQKFDASISFISIDIDSKNRLGFQKPSNYKQVLFN